MQEIIPFIGVPCFLVFCVCLYMIFKNKKQKQGIQRKFVIVAIISFFATGVLVSLTKDNTTKNNKNNDNNVADTQKNKDEDTSIETSVTPKKEPKRKATTLQWADHSNYMFSVGNNSFNGDNVPSGNYNFYITATKKDRKHIPIVWDIYISANEYTNISQVDKSEYITSIGGIDELSYSCALQQGQYVYIKYNKTVVQGSGILNIDEIIN